MFRRFLVSFGLSVVISLLVTAAVRLRELRATWGIRDADRGRPLPGDELVPDASIVETRGIDIDASAQAVWPWLVQMGYGRGGWYSYDAVDMVGASADMILPEHQSIAVGDIMPTHPGGGFRVAEVDPGRALVLYLDTELVSAQAAAQAGGESAAASAAAEGPMTPGLQMAGAMGSMSMPEFRASWAFVLDPLSEGRSRLVERFRVWSPMPSTPQRFFLPFMGYGVFLMTRKQLLGIKERAEVGRGWVPPSPAAPASSPAPGASATPAPEPAGEAGDPGAPLTGDEA